MHVERLKYTLQPDEMPRGIRRFTYQDITDDVQKAVEGWDFPEGEVAVRVQHTTCALFIQEFEDGIFEYFERLLNGLVPESKPGLGPKHPRNMQDHPHDDEEKRWQNKKENERVNGHAHISAMMSGHTSESILVLGGKLELGTYQRLILIDYDNAEEPLERTVILNSRSCS